MIKANAESMGNIKVCGDCVYFRQHYIFENGRYSPIDCGHCVFPNLKQREKLSKACKNFQGKVVRFWE